MRVSLKLVFTLLRTALILNVIILARGQDPTTTADAYSAYVDKAIPLSFRYADTYAQTSEFGLFQKLASDAQGHLSRASSAQMTIANLIPLVKGTSCPASGDGQVDLSGGLTQELAVSQLLTAADAFRNHLQAFTKIAADRPHSCEKSFDDYSIDQVKLEFAEPQVEVADGVFVCVSTDEHGNLGGGDCNTLQSIWGLFKSIWQMITNSDERAQIEAKKKELAAKRADTPYLRTAAKNACSNYVSSSVSLFAAYSDLAASYQTFQDTLPIAELQNRHKALNVCVSQFSTQQVAMVLSQARLATRQQLRLAADQDIVLALDATATRRLALNVRALSTASCGATDTRNFVREIHADIALTHLYSLPKATSLLPVANSVLAAQTKCSPNAFALRTVPVSRIPNNTMQKSSAQDVEPFLRKVPGRSREAYHQALADRSASPQTHPSASVRAPVVRRAFAVGRADPTITGTCVTVDGITFPSFCNLLQQNQPASNPSYGSSTTPVGGYCQYSNRANIGRYDMCIGQDVPFVLDGPVSDKWGAVRTIIAAATQLPGSYNLQRGAAAANVLDNQLRQLNTRIDELTTVLNDLKSSTDQYRANTIIPAVNASKQINTRVADRVNDDLTPLLHDGAVPGPEPSIPPLPDLSTLPLQNTLDTISRQDGSVAARWSGLEDLARVSQGREADLSAADRAAIDVAYGSYYDRNGMLRSSVVGESLGTVSKGIGEELKTLPSSADGVAVRREINRGLFAAANASSVPIREQALGAVSLAVASDLAYADGSRSDGDHLVSTGAEVIDFTLGLIPGVSSLNDAAQIVNGMVTGHDFAGNPTHAADYALRGVGIVVGLLPGAGEVVEISGRVLSRSFAQGASLLRRVGLAERFVDATPAARHLAVDVAESLGSQLPEAISASLAPTELEAEVRAIADSAYRIRINFDQGSTFQDAVHGFTGVARNTDRILIDEATGGAAFRIPDGFTDIKDLYGIKLRDVLVEIKSNQYSLRLGPQLSDFADFCEQQSYMFRLYVKPSATLSQPLERRLLEISAEVYDVFENGDIVQRLSHVLPR